MTSKEISLENGSNWPSVDIFVFSNGQQYLPPRKYHLRSEDLNYWKSTLSYLARMHYGALNSNIHLYTLGGRKVSCPLELRHGAYYVAIKPPDSFIDAGYEKYLIRATRSWEKQQAKRAGNAAASDKCNNNNEVINPDVRVEKPNDQLQEDNVMLKTILSSMLNLEASTTGKPEPELAIQHKLQPQRAIKPIDRKKTPIPRLAVRKNNPTTPPAPPLNLPFKKKDIIKASNIKITKPEGDKKSGYSFINANKVAAKNKMHKTATRPKETTEQTVLKKYHDAASELEASFAAKIDVNNDIEQSTSGSNLENILQDKELVLVSNFLQNPQSDIVPLLTVHPIQIQHVTKIYHEETSNLNENIQADNQEDENSQNIKREINIKATKTGVGIIKIMKAPPARSSTKEHINDRFASQNITNTFENNNVYNEVNYEINENNKTHDSPPWNHSIIVMSAVTGNQPDGNQPDANEPKDNLPDGSNNSNSKVERNIIMNSDDKTKASEVKNRDTKLNFTETDRSLDDRYVAVLNKGDVVNLKFNIEIQNHGYGSAKHDNNTADLRCSCGGCYQKQLPVVCQPIKATVSNMSPKRLVTPNQIEVPMKTASICVAMQDETTDTDDIVVFRLNIHEKDAIMIGRKKSVMIDEERTSFSDHLQICDKECCQIAVKQYGTTPCALSTPSRHITNNFTQTDWCDILFEATLLEDGHYTFRLPTLEMLKYYNL